MSWPLNGCRLFQWLQRFPIQLSVIIHTFHLGSGFRSQLTREKNFICCYGNAGSCTTENSMGTSRGLSPPHWLLPCQISLVIGNNNNYHSNNWNNNYYCANPKTMNTFHLILTFPIVQQPSRNDRKPQTNYRYCLRFCFLACDWLFTWNAITFHKYF